MPAETIRFCRESDLKNAGMVTRWVDDWCDELSAIYDAGEIIVVSTICPHFGGELEPIPGQRRLRCKWHHWEFELDTGKCLTFPISACLHRYPFNIHDGFIEVSLP